MAISNKTKWVFNKLLIIGGLTILIIFGAAFIGDTNETWRGLWEMAITLPPISRLYQALLK